MSATNGNLPIRATATFLSKGDRPGQEDYSLLDKDKGIFVVADGFGGPLPGGRASKTACEAVRNFLFREAGDLEATLPFVLRSYFTLAGNVLFNSLIHANRQVINQNKGKNIHEKGGASIIAGFIDGDLLAIANVGNCTAWLIRDGDAAELVVPRTFGRLLNPFSPLESEVQKVPLISVGLVEDLEPEIFEYRLKSGDWLVFHTDGISTHVIQSLVEVQKKKLSPEVLAQAVVQNLNLVAYQDNAALSFVAF